MLKYCNSCFTEKSTDEFAKDSYFCRECKRKHGADLFLIPERPLSEVFKAIDQRPCKKVKKEKYE